MSAEDPELIAFVARQAAWRLPTEWLNRLADPAAATTPAGARAAAYRRRLRVRAVELLERIAGNLDRLDEETGRAFHEQLSLAASKRRAMAGVAAWAAGVSVGG